MQRLARRNVRKVADKLGLAYLEACWAVDNQRLEARVVYPNGDHRHLRIDRVGGWQGTWGWGWTPEAEVIHLRTCPRPEREVPVAGGRL